MVKNLGQAVVNSVRSLFGWEGDKDDYEQLFYSSPWADIRSRCEYQRFWAEGDEWKRNMPDSRDSVTGEFEKQWPLQINPIRKICATHRAVMLGIQDDIFDGLPVKTMVSRTGLDEDDRQAAEQLDHIISDVWRVSNGHATQYESAYLTQFYGGHVFKVTWEPYNTSLPYRIAVRSFDTPAFFYPQLVDPFDNWNLLECWIGWEISKEEALAKFQISIEDAKGIYLEHWTTDQYEVTINGQVPIYEVDGEKYKASGENLWKKVPIVYIPHERSGRYWGRSLIDDDASLIGLSKELNARMADKGDYVIEAKPIPWVRNLGDGAWGYRWVQRAGKRAVEVVDLGRKTPLPGAGEPEIGIAEAGGLPEGVRAYDSEVWGELMRQGDIASVALGMDDVSGGRITGPVTAYRMWPTMQHTFSERAHYHTGLAHIADLIRTVADERTQGMNGGGYAAHGITPPEITDEMLSFSFATSWKPMIPIEKQQKSAALNERLAAGGISVVTYLKEQGDPDPEAEAERIWTDRERQAQLEADAAAEAQAAAYEARGAMQNANQSSGTNTTSSDQDG